MKDLGDERLRIRCSSIMMWWTKTTRIILYLSGLKRLGWETGEQQFRTCKNGDDFLSYGMSVLFQYFHPVSTKCKMNKILDIFDWLHEKRALIFLRHNSQKATSKFVNLKSQNRGTYNRNWFCWLHSIYIFVHMHCLKWVPIGKTSMKGKH